jgi:hypothetical protein
MRKTITATVVVLLSILTVRVADGQPALEELEELIRRESAGGPAKKADKPAAQPAQGRRPLRDLSEQGYLGAVADDRPDRAPGVQILEVLPDGPADRAGLRAGDLVTALGDVGVRQMSDMSALLEGIPVGGKVGFQILRGDKPQRIEVTLGRRPPPEERKFKQLPAPEAKKEAKPPDDDRTRIEILERRIRQLEERIERLERALGARQ